MDFWSKLLMSATKNPRMLAGMFGIGDQESYLTNQEQDKAQRAQDMAINMIAGATKPFAKGANIFAKGYGDLYRGLSGDTGYVSPLEDYIRSGITQEEHQRIEGNPYKEILKSGAGMAATLAPFSTAGTFTNAATKGTRAFGNMNTSANPFINQIRQVVARGGFEGALGGYGHSREGREFQDALTGAGLGVGGELLAEYATNKSFRDMLNEGMKDYYKQSVKVDPRTGRKSFRAGTDLPSRMVGGTSDIGGDLIEQAKRFDSAEEFYNRMSKETRNSLRDAGIRGSEQVQRFWEESAGSSKIPSLEGAMQHRPSKAAPVFDIERAAPDFYEHPEWYHFGGREYDESVRAIRQIRGKPNADVTVYRAGPKGELRTGDWITLSPAKAKLEALTEGVPVHEFKVRAKDVQFAGDDITEFGYWGNRIEKR